MESLAFRFSLKQLTGIMVSSDKNIEYIADFVEEAKRWLSLRSEYAKLDAIDKVVRICTALTLSIVLLLLFMLVLIYLSFALAYALEGVMHSLPLGFLCVSMCYLLLLIIFIVKRHAWIERPLVRFLVGILKDSRSSN